MLSRSARVLVGLAFALPLAGPLAFVACSPFSSDSSSGTVQTADGGLPDSQAPEGASPIADASSDHADCDASFCRAVTDRYVFVTAGTLSGSFALEAGAPEALAVADRFCTAQANADVTHPDLAGRHWRAWLCTPTVSAIGRAGVVEARWIRPNGVVVFSSTSELRGGTTDAGIDISSQPVWTGCSGELGQAINSLNCNSWTSDDPAISAYIGFANRLDRTWSAVTLQVCSTASPIYCFENDVP